MPSRAPYRPADARTPRRGILALPLAPVVRYRGAWARLCPVDRVAVILATLVLAYSVTATY